MKLGKKSLNKLWYLFLVVALVVFAGPVNGEEEEYDEVQVYQEGANCVAISMFILTFL